MLNYHSFVRNEHTCLLSDDAIFSPRLPTISIWDLGFGISDC